MLDVFATVKMHSPRKGPSKGARIFWGKPRRKAPISHGFPKADGIQEEPAALHVHKMLSVARRSRGEPFGMFQWGIFDKLFIKKMLDIWDSLGCRTKNTDFSKMSPPILVGSLAYDRYMYIYIHIHTLHYITLHCIHSINISL